MRWRPFQCVSQMDESGRTRPVAGSTSARERVGDHRRDVVPPRVHQRGVLRGALVLAQGPQHQPEAVELEVRARGVEVGLLDAEAEVAHEADLVGQQPVARSARSSCWKRPPSASSMNSQRLARLRASAPAAAIATARTRRRAPSCTSTRPAAGSPAPRPAPRCCTVAGSVDASVGGEARVAGLSVLGEELAQEGLELADLRHRQHRGRLPQRRLLVGGEPGRHHERLLKGGPVGELGVDQLPRGAAAHVRVEPALHRLVGEGVAVVRRRRCPRTAPRRPRARRGRTGSRSPSRRPVPRLPAAPTTSAGGAAARWRSRSAPRECGVPRGGGGAHRAAGCPPRRRSRARRRRRWPPPSPSRRWRPGPPSPPVGRSPRWKLCEAEHR